MGLKEFKKYSLEKIEEELKKERCPKCNAPCDILEVAPEPVFNYAGEKLKKDGAENKTEMMRIAAIVSAALVQSEDGMANYIKVSKKTDNIQQISKWKLAGRYDQMGRRPPY